MTKHINILLKKNINGLGLIGEIKSVTKGYARNYLIPNNLGEIIAKNRIKHILMLEKIKVRKKQEERIQSIKTKEHLEDIKKIRIRKKVSQQNNTQIFGSITDKEIAEKIFHTAGIKIDKRKVELPVIKSIGNHKIRIKIKHDIYADLTLQVLPEDID